MSDDERIVSLESELAETRRKLAETEQHLASANQIIGSYSTARCGLVKGHTDPRYDALAQHLKSEIAEKEEARAQLALVRTSTEGVWMWQGGVDEPQSLACPVVMRAGTLRSLLRRTQFKEIAAYLRGEEWKHEDHPFQGLDRAVKSSPNDLVRWLADRIEAKWEAAPPDGVMHDETHAHYSTDRCQRRDGEVQCTLPEGHRCDDVFGAPPLTMLQALAWAEEQSLTKKTERQLALGELKRRADWLAEECHKGGTCFAERDEAYTAVRTLENFYAHGAVRRIGEARADDANARTPPVVTDCDGGRPLCAFCHQRVGTSAGCGNCEHIARQCGLPPPKATL